MPKQSLASIAKGVRTAMKKHSPEILTGIGIAGMITTTVMAVKATPKALILLEEKKDELDTDRLEPKDIIKTAWPCYIPAAVVGSISVFCLIGASSTNLRRNAALATAYTLSESTLKEYQEKVVETIGEKKEQSIRDSVSKDKMVKNPVREVILTESGGNTICYDVLSGRYFKSDRDKDFDKAKKMLGGALAKYLTDENAAADLAQALKIAINSVYGLTSAGFENPFRDNRNKDNIVAKRGALFMVNLKHAVQSQGFTVAHIKTDSIKIPDATPEIIKFVTEYGKLYGYNFEHEATYDRMCLVNDAVYIARYATVEKCCDLYGKKYIDSAKDICKENKKHPYAWTATGTQFQIPYVFKTLFSKENIEFEDMCETKSVTSSLYLDMNEALPDVSALEAERDKLWKQITDSKRMTEPMPTECERSEELTDEIAKGHDYHFIGKVGQFCPIKPGCGGGILLRETENKKTGEKGYAAATGSKGFRWLESEMVKQLDKQGDIDRGYYNNMVDEAVKSLSVYGDFERFAADEPYVSDNTPPWFGAGEPHEDDTTPFDVR